jgi:hypothetical protein
MSMNLQCKEVDLWQTPTSITYMCYSNKDGGSKGILYRYSEWVKGSLNRGYKDAEEADWARENVNDHLAQFMGKKKLTFSIV